MPRRAAVVYPKDAAQIVAMADIFPGARVVEAGVGLRGADLLAAARRRPARPRLVVRAARRSSPTSAEQNVDQFFGGRHPAWKLTVGDLVESLDDERRRPGRPRHAGAVGVRRPGRGGAHPGRPGLRLRRHDHPARPTVETLREHGGFTEPQPWETLVRDWHVEGLAVRPDHRMIGHTGFLVTARRMAPGETAPAKKRRPAPGAYGVDYEGPRPGGLPPQVAEEPFDA